MRFFFFHQQMAWLPRNARLRRASDFAEKSRLQQSHGSQRDIEWHQQAQNCGLCGAYGHGGFKPKDFWNGWCRVSDSNRRPTAYKIVQAIDIIYE